MPLIARLLATTALLTLSGWALAGPLSVPEAGPALPQEPNRAEQDAAWEHDHAGTAHARSAATHPEADAETERARRILSPHIEGDTLVIEGRIDSHIYDYLQYEAAKIAPVKVIDLNSLGGNAEWALAIARKVRDLGKATLLRSGHYCASACAAIFAAGRERLASEDTWIGIHGARLGAGYLTTFQGLCFVDLDTGSAFEPRKKGCQAFLGHWYALTMASTSEAFDIMESSGVSPDLRKTYFEMPDDPEWPAQLNALRKPDWPISAPEALKYNLVTKLLRKTDALARNADR